MLVYFDPWIAGVVMPTLIIFGLMVILTLTLIRSAPAITPGSSAKFEIGTFLFGFIVLWISMITIGTFIRGPGWQWFLARANLGSQPPHLRGQSRFARPFSASPPNLARSSSAQWQSADSSPSAASWCTPCIAANNAKNYQRKSLLQYSILMVFFL